MTEIMTTTETKVLSVVDYEARIHLYKEQIGIGYIGIGRTLNEAKAAGVVPEGQWEAWMTEVTGLTARQAQRCMQAAREIKDGSALARLEMSKAMRLLSSGLSEDEREELAEKVSQDDLTVKELEAEIRKLKTGFDQAVDQAKQWEERAREAFNEGQKSAQRAGNVEENLRLVEMTERIRKEQTRNGDLELKLGEMRGQLHTAEQRAQHAEDQLKRRIGADQEQYRIGMEAGKKEAERTAAQHASMMQDKLHRQEEILAQQAAQLQQLKAERRQQQMAEARGANSEFGNRNSEVPISEMILLLISKTRTMDPNVFRKDKALAGELIALEKWIERARQLIGVEADGSVE